MEQHSSRYTVLFAGAVCAVFSFFVAFSAVSLKDRQLENKLLDMQTKVLTVAGLMDERESLSREEVKGRFDQNVSARVVNLATGSYADEIDAASFDQREAAADPDTSRPAPPNQAKVRRVPEYALVYQVEEEGKLRAVILPIEGKGLWSTLYGFLSLSADMRTIEGITFYEHGETPGLGGEVDNPRWKGLWKGRLAFDEQWERRIEVLKGAAGPVDQDPYRVDGLSGATITSRGVSNTLAFWLGDDGFGPFLSQLRSERGI